MRRKLCPDCKSEVEVDFDNNMWVCPNCPWCDEVKGGSTSQ